MSFSPVEEQLLKENYDKTIGELEELLFSNGYKRSRKSINRKLEKMREEGVIGFRSTSTVRRSYRQRTRRKDTPVPSEIEQEDDSWDTGVDWNDVE